MKRGFLFIVLIALIPLDGFSQCAMCKAVAETSTQAGSSVATGLNSGIMYLMFFPYLLMGGIGYAIYKHRKKQRA